MLGAFLAPTPTTPRRRSLRTYAGVRMSFEGCRLLGGARKKTAAGLREAAERVRLRTVIQTIAKLHPRLSNSALHKKFVRVEPAASRTVQWCGKWRLIQAPTDRRQNNTRRRRYTDRQKEAIVQHAVGLARRLNRDGTKSKSHSQRVTASWWNIRHPGAKLCQQVVGDFLKQAGYHWRLRPSKCRLQLRNRQQRESLCDAWGNSPAEDWEDIVFTDSTWAFVEHQPNRHNQGLYVKDGEDVPPFTGTKHPAKVHVYGALTCKGMAGPIFAGHGVNSKTYREDILPQLVEAIRAKLGDKKVFTLQQDGAPAHFAKATMPILEGLFANDPDAGFWAKGYWPAASADLSPIENAWSDQQRTVSPADDEPASLEELRSRITKWFAEYPAATCLNLLHSMPNRLRLCREAEFYTTKY